MNNLEDYKFLEGRNLLDVEAILDARNIEMRVVKRDGVNVIGTDDVQENRLNVEQYGRFIVRVISFG